MAIEFRCIRCGQLLRVPDTDQGKRARCPTCIAVVDIPGDNATTASPLMMSREKSDVIDYELFGEESQYVEITLDPGEVTVAKLEHLLYASPGIAMESAIAEEDVTEASFLRRISQVGRRMVAAGNSLRMTAFCNVAQQREVVAFSPQAIGRLIPVHLNEFNGQVVCNSDSILCLARGIEMTDVQVDALSDVLSMHRITGDGIAVLYSSGQLFHRELKANKQFFARASSVIAYTSGIQISRHELHSVGEVVPVCSVTGPGEIWLRTGTM